MEQNIQSQLGATVRLNADFEDVLAKTIDALKTEGFGVLTEIDIKETLKKKLNFDQLPYKILGACNPTLASGLDRGSRSRSSTSLQCNCPAVTGWSDRSSSG